MQRVIGFIVVVIVAVGIIYIAYKHDAATKQGTSNASPAATIDAAAQPIVRYNGTAFSPANYTINIGGSIVFLNTSTGPLTVVSDPSTSQTDHPVFDLSIAPGTSKGLTITKAGKWGYYNQQNPSVTGVVVAQ